MVCLPCHTLRPDRGGARSSSRLQHEGCCPAGSEYLEDVVSTTIVRLSRSSSSGMTAGAIQTAVATGDPSAAGERTIRRTGPWSPRSTVSVTIGRPASATSIRTLPGTGTCPALSSRTQAPSSATTAGESGVIRRLPAGISTLRTAARVPGGSCHSRLRPSGPFTSESSRGSVIVPRTPDEGRPAAYAQLFSQPTQAGRARPVQVWAA